MDDLRAISTSVGSIDYSKERVQTSPSNDAPFVKTINKIAALGDEINAEIDRFVDKKHKIINQIHSLQNCKYSEILYKRYVEFKRLEVIAVEMNYSYDYIRHAHGYALRDFGGKYLN